MKAIILAAGYATRLYPLTKNQPKALLPLAGKPILDYIVEKIEEVPAIDEILLITNTKFYPNFCAWAENKKGGLSVSVFDDGTDSDETKLGAIGDLQFLIDKVGIDDDILLMASDNYFEFSLKDFYNFYLEKGAESICAKRIDSIDDLRRMAVAKIDETGKVLHLEEKPKEPKSDVAVFATYIYQKETIKKIRTYLDEGNSPDAPGNFPAWLYSKQPVYLYLFEGECFDIGTPDSYAYVNELLEKGGNK